MGTPAVSGPSTLTGAGLVVLHNPGWMTTEPDFVLSPPDGFTLSVFFFFLGKTPTLTHADAASGCVKPECL